MNGWQTIETAPLGGEFIICFEPVYGVSVAWFCPVEEQWESLNNEYPMRQCVDKEYYIFQCDPTHWMPLPAPPSITS